MPTLVYETARSHNLILLKYHNKPDGQSDVGNWLRDPELEEVPQNVFMRDVFEINLQAHAWNTVHKVFPRLHLVYAGTEGVQPVLLNDSYTLPSTIINRLLVSTSHLLQDTRALSTQAERQVINAGWSYQASRWAMFPEVFAVDSQANRNKERLATVLFVGKDGNNKNIIAAQGIIQDLKAVSLHSFCKLLIKILPPESLACSGAGAMDGDPQQKTSYLGLKSQGILPPEFFIIPCAFHAITQELADPDVLGKTHVNSVVYELVLTTLHDINFRYRRREHAIMALNCVTIYGRQSLTHHQFRSLSTYITKMTNCLPEWGFCYRLKVLSLKVRTSSYVEGEHSLVSRTKNGGMGLNAASSLSDTPDAWNTFLDSRVQEQQLKLLKHSASASTTAPLAIRHLTRVLTDWAFDEVNEMYNELLHLTSEFKAEPTAHWYP